MSRGFPAGLDRDVRAYFITRVAVALGLLLIALVGGVLPTPEFAVSLFRATVALLGLVTVVQVVAIAYGELPPDRVLVWTVPFDLLALGVLSFVRTGYGDVFYALVLAFPVFYALAVGRRQAWVVGMLTASVYAIGFTLSRPPTAEGLPFVAFKAAAIVFVGGLVANSVEFRRQREQQLAAADAEKTKLNLELRERLDELHSVSEINEVVHSSLDFDRAGPQVVEIVSRVIGVEQCSLFVIERDSGKTLFSATHDPAASYRHDSPASLLADEHFACIQLLEHRNAIVLFCAPQPAVEGLGDEARIVLSAVASELVVAVENSRLYQLTRRLAITDELTGLANYRHLQERLADEVGRARRYGTLVSLIMIDVDDFKRFNDLFGHPEGDRALREVGHLLARSVREVDVCARYGGEEFAIVLPETDAAGAFVVAEKVREAVSAHDFCPDCAGECACHLTVSAGIATLPTHAADKEALLREADHALYRAKAAGKNKVRSPLVRAGSHEGRDGGPGDEVGEQPGTSDDTSRGVSA